MSDFTHLSLFSGIGGLDIAAEWAGFRTVGQCEWADFPTKVLEKHWPEVPRWRDIRTLTGESFYEKTGLRTVDAISGGFPCQPFSVAGKRRGTEDDRYLWPEMLRVISEIRPTWVIGENVVGIVTMALDTVLSDLESIGYTCQALIIPACAVDAPHRRDRIAIVAYNANSNNAGAVKAVCRRSDTEPSGSSETLANCNGIRLEKKRPEQQSAGASGGGQDVADDNGNGFLWPGSKSAARRNTDQEYSPVTKSRNVSDTNGADGERAGTPKVKTGQPQFTDGDRRSAQPGLGGMVDGLPRWLDEPGDVPRIATGVKDRVNRLKCLGNAVVPQQFYPIFRAIAEIEMEVFNG